MSAILTGKEGIDMSGFSLQGVIDMHVHSNPDIRKRAYDDFELMEAAIRVGARAIVLKSHQGATMDRAYLCNRHNRIVHGGANRFTMFGGITLNRQVGGLNPAAAETALALGAKVVWLPTSSAVNHRIRMNQDPSDGICVLRDGKPVPELLSIFRLCREYDAVLGTAHLSPAECFTVVEAARAAGVRKVVVTHPEWWLVGMRLEDQVRIVRDYGVVLERCFAQNMGGGRYKSNLPDNVRVIEAVGYEHVLISTDGGQVENPHWEIAMAQYLQYLADHGIPEAQIAHMSRTLPARLLGIDP